MVFHRRICIQRRKQYNQSKKYLINVSTTVNHTLPTNIGSNKKGGATVKELFGIKQDIFDKPKPVELFALFVIY